ncbi:MAG: echA8 6 [Ilumatobacteraceae bacterium]|nr:echA8 6 [Ilumatobacteraceae bacterium]
MTEPLVLSELRDPGILLITLNRPDQLNAWGADMAAEFFTIVDAAIADPAVRVIVVTGAGKGFCAGASMTALNEIRDNPAEGAGPATGDRPVTDLASLPKPIIAAINGAVAGVGLSMALFCDLRFTTTTAKFTTSFARRGLIAEYGSSWMLPRLVGTARAMDLLLSGRVITGAEAAVMGLVNAATEPDALIDHVLAYATDLAENGCPTSWSIMKQQVLADADRPLDQATAVAIDLMNASVTRPDFQEGVQSFLDRRPPAFAPYSPQGA